MYAKNTGLGRLGVDFLVDALSLGLVMAIAAFLRFYRLSELPPGLHQDEAIYALNALPILDGDPQIYFGEREPLCMYLTAGLMLLAPSTFLSDTMTVRLTSAIVGTFTVLALYLCTREMLGRRIAVLSAAIAATTLWPVMMSRVGFSQ